MTEPKLIKRSDGWMLVCPREHMMVVRDGFGMETITDQMFIVLRKV